MFTKIDVSALTPADRERIQVLKGITPEGTVESGETLEDIKKMMSNFGNPYTRVVSEYPGKYFGNTRIEETTFTTNDKDGVPMVCAKVFMDKNTKRLIGYVFTTNDVLNAGNFPCFPKNREEEEGVSTAASTEQMTFGGIKPAQSMAAIRRGLLQPLMAEGRSGSDSKKPRLDDSDSKRPFRGSVTTPKMVWQIAQTSTFLPPKFLRDVLGEKTSHIPMAEKPVPKSNSKEDKKAADEVFKNLQAEEMRLLREVMERECTVIEFAQEYLETLDKACKLPTSTPPVKFRDLGRATPQTEDLQGLWGHLAFLAVLCQKFKGLCQPVEGGPIANTRLLGIWRRLKFESMAEANPFDKIWAFAPPNGMKLNDQFFNTPEGRQYLLDELEKAAVVQFNFLSELAYYCDNEMIVEAYDLLTIGTEKIQGKLGVVDALLSMMLTGQIKFPERLKDMIVDEFARDGISVFRPLDWEPVYDSQSPEELIKQIGMSMMN